MITEFIKFIVLVIPTFVLAFFTLEYFGPSIMLIVAIPIWFLSYVGGVSKSKSLKCRDTIDSWAKSENYKIVVVDRSLNPFRLSTSGVQYKYTVTVQDFGRNNHHFIIVLGHWWFGLLKKDISVTVNENV
jgi:hypothetical protein